MKGSTCKRMHYVSSPHKILALTTFLLFAALGDIYWLGKVEDAPRALIIKTGNRDELHQTDVISMALSGDALSHATLDDSIGTPDDVLLVCLPHSFCQRSSCSQQNINANTVNKPACVLYAAIAKAVLMISEKQGKMDWTSE